MLSDCTSIQQVMVRGQLDLLIESMTQRTNIWISGRSVNTYGVCNAIEVEDGSGHRFNLHISTNEGKQVVYLDLANGIVVTKDRSPIICWTELKAYSSLS